MFDDSWRIIDNRGTTDAAVNMALEEYTVRHTDAQFSYLLIYVDQPGVILGRHQNVLQEVDLETCWQENIPLVRRISGGGTVVHDEGNLNISFITAYSLKNFNRYRQFLEPIIRVLRGFGVPVDVDDRNNLTIEGRKISGNAQFTSRNRMLSHGTLLFNADLERIRRILHRPGNLHIQSCASNSVPSPITNIKPYLKAELNINGLQEAIVREIFGSAPQWHRFSQPQWREIEDLAGQKYRSFEWTIAESPEAQVRVQVEDVRPPVEVSYRLEKGRFTRMHISDESVNFIARFLENRPLSRETFDQLQNEIEQISDQKVRTKAQKILQQMI